MTIDWANPYRGQRVLVTGVGGLADCVCRVLEQAGAELFRAAGPGEFASAYREARPVATFNLADYGAEPEETDGERADAVNARLPMEMVRTISSDDSSDWPGLRLVQCGSAQEYGETNQTVNEDSPAQPVAMYGRTKLAATEAVVEACQRGLRAAVARLFTRYGPGEPAGHLLPSLMRIARTGESLTVESSQQQRDFIYLDDAAEGLLRLGLQRAPFGVMNLATGRLTAVRQFAEVAAELLNLRADQLQFSETPASIAPAGPADITRMKKMLFWKPAISVRDGISRTIAASR